MDEAANYQVSRLTLLDWNSSDDLCIFSCSEADGAVSGKVPYNLTTSEYCTLEHFANEDGLATAIYGLWAKKPVDLYIQTDLCT